MEKMDSLIEIVKQIDRKKEKYRQLNRENDRQIEKQGR